MRKGGKGAECETLNHVWRKSWQPLCHENSTIHQELSWVSLLYHHFRPARFFFFFICFTAERNDEDNKERKPTELVKILFCRCQSSGVLTSRRCFILSLSLSLLLFFYFLVFYLAPIRFSLSVGVRRPWDIFRGPRRFVRFLPGPEPRHVFYIVSLYLCATLSNSFLAAERLGSSLWANIIIGRALLTEKTHTLTHILL